MFALGSLSTLVDVGRAGMAAVDWNWHDGLSCAVLAVQRCEVEALVGALLWLGKMKKLGLVLVPMQARHGWGDGIISTFELPFSPGARLLVSSHTSEQP